MLRILILSSLILLLAAGCSDPEPEIDVQASINATVGTIPSPTPFPDVDEATEPEPPRPTAAPTATAAPVATATSAPVEEAEPTNPATPTPFPPTPTPTPVPATPTPVPPAEPENVALALTQLVTLNRPVALSPRPNTATLYVAENSGRIVELLVDGNSGSVGRDVLNLQGRISNANEQGLLGLTFSADGNQLFVNFTDGAGATTIARYAMSDGVADVGTETVLLSVPQPAANHNGGEIRLGPDGKLWIGMGDGGGAGDQFRHGQNINTLHGSVLRLNTDGTVPADNPFVGIDGADEAWLVGVRNAWRFSFDQQTGDLWIGDVGQNAIEEVTVLYNSAGRGKGANLGWPFVEGTRPFQQAGPPAGGNYVGPIFQYEHNNGCSVTGGYVYRGSAIAALDGVYIFGDFCTSQIWGIVSSEAGGYQSFVNFGLGMGDQALASFGEDNNGELYVLNAAAGTVARVDPA